MSNYGRNFEFRQSPDPKGRLGRYKNGDAVLPQGVPVIVPDGAENDAFKRLPLELATGAQAPIVGKSGILIHEWGFNAYRGLDPAITVVSDFDYVPADAPSQLVFGTDVKVALKNTEARSFQGQRDYPGRIMVAGLGATPTVAVGTYLTPGVGDDTDGYWAETSDLEDAWLFVTLVDEFVVEAQLLF